MELSEMEVTNLSIKNFFLGMAAAVAVLVISVNGWSALWLIIPGWAIGNLAWKADRYDELGQP